MKTLAELEEKDRTLVENVRSAVIGALMDPEDDERTLKLTFFFGSGYFDSVFIDIITHHPDLRKELEEIAKQDSLVGPQFEPEKHPGGVYEALSANRMVQQGLSVVLLEALNKGVPDREKFDALLHQVKMVSLNRLAKEEESLGDHSGSAAKLRKRLEEQEKAAETKAHSRINPAKGSGRERGGSRPREDKDSGPSLPFGHGIE